MTDALGGEQRFCQRCDYVLRGLGKRGLCPECGLDFDLSDKRTTHAGPPMSWLMRRWLASIGLPQIFITAVLLIAWGLLFTHPAMVYELSPATGLFCASVPVLVVLASARAAVAQRVQVQRPKVYGKLVRRDAALSALLIVGVLAAPVSQYAAAVPTRIVAAPFWGELEAVADEAEQLPPRWDDPNGPYILPPRQIGLWTVTPVHLAPGMVILRVGQEASLVRRRSDALEGFYNLGRVVHLHGDWYIWARD